MTSNLHTIDEQIMQLVGMGFALEDCQEAIQNGKLSVAEAVEWLLNGKPKSVHSSNATLKLHFNQVSDMDTTASPGSSSSVNKASSSSARMEQDALEQMDVQAANVETTDGQESGLSTRLFVSDEQRCVKQRFEEKQREEARRIALAEKQAKKKAHEEALKRIQEDRELQKQRGSVASSASADNRASAATSSSTTKVIATDINTARTQDAGNAIIQVRLPNGQTVKQSFSGLAILQDVCQFIEEQCAQCTRGAYTLIQPFPRLEFSEQVANKSLKELGLVPSGSLVVKLNTTVVSDATSAVSDVPDDSSVAEAATVTNPPVTQPPAPSHNWGPGQQLEHDEDVNAAQNIAGAEMLDAEMEAEDNSVNVGIIGNNNVDDVDDDDQDVAGNIPAHGGPGFGFGPGAGQPPVPPGWGRGGGFPPGFIGGPPGFGGAGFPGMGRGQPGWGGIGHGQHNWGDGQRLAGAILENVILPHHNQDPKQLAAEAARRRYGTDQPTSTSHDAAVHSLPAAEVPTLRFLVIKHVTASICSARQTYTGLHGLPSSLALQILAHIVKEGLLRPKILHAFISCHLNSITLDSYPYCTNELLAAFRHHLYLKHLSLQSCPLITHHGVQHLTVLKHLKYLNIGSCRQISDSVVPVLVAMPSLVTLVLEGTAVTDAGVIQYANSRPPCLQNLDLSRTNITQSCFSALQGISCLKQLNLEQTKITGLSGIEGLQQLHTLNLANTSIVTEAVLCLMSVSSLTALNLANTINANGDMVLQYIADRRLTYLQLPNRLTTTDRGISFLTNMPLAMLDLTNFIYITDASLEYIGRIATLRKLRLSNTKISDAGLPFLEGLRDLDELHVDRTLVTDTGADIVKAFPRLLELNLSHTGVTDSFLTSGALNFCRQLSKLNLSKTNVSDKGMVRLRLPQLTMLNIDSTYCLPDIAYRLPGCPLLESVVFRTLRTPPRNEEF